jgi:hypothetical protein
MAAAQTTETPISKNTDGTLPVAEGKHEFFTHYVEGHTVHLDALSLPCRYTRKQLFLKANLKKQYSGEPVRKNQVALASCAPPAANIPRR